jgi:hypothetical protein
MCTCVFRFMVLVLMMTVKAQGGQEIREKWGIIPSNSNKQLIHNTYSERHKNVPPSFLCANSIICSAPVHRQILK